MGELLRRRVMMGDKPDGPLYPLPERTSGVFAGTGGQIAQYNYGGNVRYVSFYRAKHASSTSGLGLGTAPKVFTIPAGATCEWTIEMLETNNQASTFQMRIAMSTSTFWAYSSALKAGQSVTLTKIAEADTDISDITVYIRGVDGVATGKIKFTLMVNGVQYI